MILYINGNYPHHSLHSELVSKMADLGNEITVFVPMKGKEFEGKYLCSHPKVRVVYSDCLKTTDRLFFISKIKHIAKEIEKQVEINKVNCILAGTVYSDGAVAYLLHEKYGIPFSVAVRETDVTYQMKWRPYLNGYIRRMLKAVSNVIFLSPAYQKYLDKFGCNQEKYVLIPNAVNDYWFQNHPNTRLLHNPLSLIYVGEISERKNVTTTVSVVAELNKKEIPTIFHIVGSGDKEEDCRALANELGVSDKVFFHGWQNGKEKIRDYYDQSDIFVMPSLRETFGTVYIEALSQGLPVIYTRDQGIDGYFEQGAVGYSCDPQNVEEIVTAIIAIKGRYSSVSDACLFEAQRFQWEVIAEKYNGVINNMRDR